MTTNHERKVDLPGEPVAVFAEGDTGNGHVEIWCQSPTGDQSDTQIFRLECTDLDQARAIAHHWRGVWNLSADGSAKASTRVVILDRLEAEALTDCLLEHPTLAEDYPALDELANEMAGRT